MRPTPVNDRLALRSRPMDDIGHRYLLLALRLGRHLPDLVHAYVGPPDLRELVEGEPLTPTVELHDEALRLVELADARADGDAGARRAAFLRGQLTAMSAMARLLTGEEITFPDRVELLLGCRIEPEPEKALEEASATLSGLLPGDGTLAERLARHDATLTPESGRVLPEMEVFAEVLRRRCAQEWGLPDGELVEWIDARGGPFTAFARYLGGCRTRIELNLDIPLTISRMLHFAAHEVYPGHHMERSTKETRLVRNEDRGEAMVLVACTPESLVLEGMAEHALGLTLTKPEIAYELEHAAARTGLTGDVRVDAETAGPRAVLSRAVVAAAIGRSWAGWSTSSTRDYLREVGLVGAERAARGAAMLDDPIRAMILLNYPLGASLAGRWLEVVGQSDGVRRHLEEQLVPEQLLAEIGEPRPLFPGSLA
jgi:hypothetical protein